MSDLDPGDICRDGEFYLEMQKALDTSDDPAYVRLIVAAAVVGWVVVVVIALPIVAVIQALGWLKGKVGG